MRVKVDSITKGYFDENGKRECDIGFISADFVSQIKITKVDEEFVNQFEVDKIYVLTLQGEQNG